MSKVSIICKVCIIRITCKPSIFDSTKRWFTYYTYYPCFLPTSSGFYTGKQKTNNKNNIILFLIINPYQAINSIKKRVGFVEFVDRRAEDNTNGY